MIYTPQTKLRLSELPYELSRALYFYKFIRAQIAARIENEIVVVVAHIIDIVVLVACIEIKVLQLRM